MTPYERIRSGLIATQKDDRRTFITAVEFAALRRSGPLEKGANADGRKTFRIRNGYVSGTTFDD